MPDVLPPLPLLDPTRRFARLPQRLEYHGEFGLEITIFLPFMNWLSSAGLLTGRTICTYAGMRCFYDDLACATVLERDEPRHYAKAQMPAWMPVFDEHSLTRHPFLMPPDLRAKFGQFALQPDPSTPERPLLIIHNKYTTEWRGEPRNFLDGPTLDGLFSTLKKMFTVVYIRHGIRPPPSGYSTDAAGFRDLGDAALLAAHPEVSNFDDLYAAHLAGGGEMDLNTFKNVLYSRCYRFIGVQGGGSHHISCYKGSLMILLHRNGEEARLAYSERGFYSFLANPAPSLALCRSGEEILAAAVLFEGSQVADGRLVVRPSRARLFERYARNRRLPGQPLVRKPVVNSSSRPA